MTQLPVDSHLLKKLDEKKLSTYEQLARLLPSKYYDSRFENGLSESFNGLYVTVIGRLTSMQKKAGAKADYVSARLTDRLTGKNLTIFWFGNPHIYRIFECKVGIPFIVYGKLKFDNEYHSYCMSNPIIFSEDVLEKQQLTAHYRKFKGISEATMTRLITSSCYYDLKDPVPADILSKYKLLDLKNMAWKIHYPKEPSDIYNGYKRLVFDDLLYFAIQMRMKQANNGAEYPEMPDRSSMDRLKAELPYPLTEDQQNVTEALYRRIQNKECVNALVQGDVSCGKTTVAILMMFLAAGNGYQSVLMAPTEALASQHYKEIRPLAENAGLSIIYLSGNMKKKEKDTALQKISQHASIIIIGTHSVASEDVKYHNLGMILIDEEQRFGVKIKEALRAKSAYSAPYITLSATPIPRSIGETIYDDSKQVYSIRSLPAGRKPVETFCQEEDSIPSILDQELSAGRQAYVICPKIDESEEDDEQKIKSIEETVREYESHFTNTPFRVGVLTGKSGKAKNNDNAVLQDFMENKIQVLIATTVVEVGINNPNASVIVIQNAERYGLSTMHQLRGRVKRGSYKPYCILQSKDGMSNPRLALLCNTEDGFEIAEEDFKLRESGNLLGLEQSGQNKYIRLACQYPNMYKKIKQIAMEMILMDTADKFIDYMDSLENNN